MIPVNQAADRINAETDVWEFVCFFGREWEIGADHIPYIYALFKASV